MALREVNNDKYCIKKKSKLLNESKKKILLKTRIERHVGQNPKGIGNRCKNRQIGFYQIKNLLDNKGNNDGMYRQPIIMAENICKLWIW